MTREDFAYLAKIHREYEEYTDMLSTRLNQMLPDIIMLYQKYNKEKVRGYLRSLYEVGYFNPDSNVFDVPMEDYCCGDTDYWNIPIPTECIWTEDWEPIYEAFLQRKQEEKAKDERLAKEAAERRKKEAEEAKRKKDEENDLLEYERLKKKYEALQEKILSNPE